jgi:hypothetical protein
MYEANFNSIREVLRHSAAGIAVLTLLFASSVAACGPRKTKGDARRSAKGKMKYSGRLAARVGVIIAKQYCRNMLARCGVKTARKQK